MALQLAGNTVINEDGEAFFNYVTVSSNGYLEVADSASVNLNSNSFQTLSGTTVSANNAMWSWWIKPLVLRDKNASNHWTYACFTQSNGAVGVSITNHDTGTSNQYTITPENAFAADDHNASAVVAGNNKVAIFIQGRVANSAVLNPNNMFYIEFNEGESPAGKNLTNVTFSTAPTATTSGYPNAFNANGKFLLIGRQQQPNTANQWLAVTGDWPLANLSSPKGMFASSNTWMYFALRRSYLDKDVINFAHGWHPYNSNSDKTIRYGSILRNGNSAPWDVYSNGSIIGNITNETNLPFDEFDFETVYTKTGANNSIRLFDVHDNAVAFGLFDVRINRIQYKMAYKSGNTWTDTTICDGGMPFNGVQVRDYYGGMAISERNKYIVTVSVENNNRWEIREYESSDSGNTWVVNDATEANLYEIAGRPMEEVLSEDSHIYSSANSLQLGSFSWFGAYDGTDYNVFTTNVSSTRALATGTTGTTVDADRKLIITSFNVAQTAYVEVVS